MNDYISREAALNLANELQIKGIEGYEQYNQAVLNYCAELVDVPAADVVARDCFNRILSENDVMREQLAGIGKKPGDKMDDVRPVAHAYLIYHDDEFGGRTAECSNCHVEGMLYGEFCVHCGAQMDGGEKF